MAPACSAALAPAPQHEPLPALGSSLPPFPDPLQADPQLQRFLDAAVAQLCQWWSGSGQRSPLPLLSVLPDLAPPTEGQPPQALLADLQLVMDGAFNPSHPGALAHLDPPPLAAAVAAELVAAGLNNNLLAEELSPSLTRLERGLCGWMATALGLGDQAGGVAASGGSLSNLMALVVARYRSGLAGEPSAVVLCSADAHVSLSKALMVMGLPASALWPVPVDAAGALSIAALELALERTDAEGRVHREAAYYHACNRGKRSIIADFAKADDLDRVKALCGEADVVIENFKTGDLDRYGLGYAALSAAHPRLVYLSLTGFGRTGPRS
ncbi:MAG: hypothetical protein EB126_12010, partial [Synechococcaceae bacterium WBB_10_009]|nr:hypothetical protein [Synechococcaceae bacterium WBB_10_009]